MPLRRDIRTTCTCPDDDNWDGYACKHVVATMFTLSDEFLLEPELLDLWRNRTDRRRRPPTGRRTGHDDRTRDDGGRQRRRQLLSFGSGPEGQGGTCGWCGRARGPASAVPAREVQRPMVDPLADLLRSAPRAPPSPRSSTSNGSSR